MRKGNMSEVAHPQSELNPSEHSLKSQIEEPERRPSPRSEHPAASAVSLTSHKTQLLRLMVEVKLQAIGFRDAEVAAFLQRQMWVLSEVQEMQINQLNTIAFLMVEIFLQEKVDEAQNPAFRDRVHRGRPRLNLRSQYRNPSWHDFSQSSQEQNRAEIEGPHRRPLQRMSHTMQRMQVEQVERIPAAFDNSRTILCSICCSPSFQFCEQPCSHTFCDSCLKGYIREVISSGTYSINCPQYHCPHFISKETIKKLLNPSEYQRFAYFKDKNQKEMNPSNQFCSRPDCGEVLQKKGDSLACPKCQEKYCEVCLQREHRGQECDVALKAAMDHTYSLYKIKKCPNCKSPIQKDSGCNHMTCKKCKHQFCWICLKEYSVLHFKYYNCCGCPGMMFVDEQSYYFEKVKLICIFLLLPLILVLLLGLYLLSVPLFMVGCLFLKPFEWISKDNEMCEKDLAKCLFGCQGFFEIVYYVVAWLLLQPRTILYAIFMAPIQITMICCKMAGRAFE